ncbi:hypothetical protein B0H17DRAFT_1134716 [Mycena rosella]|uniref:Uncharacterized protein n=1 Tax=Mycena rosella TaxID=1033263 RepID=A0AAD7DEG5_MYCRO|nr:hypothetical protein B0H17DRAFT_1134716 [Mycena rosella]
MSYHPAAPAERSTIIKAPRARVAVLNADGPSASPFFAPRFFLATTQSRLNVQRQTPSHFLPVSLPRAGLMRRRERRPPARTGPSGGPSCALGGRRARSERDDGGYAIVSVLGRGDLGGKRRVPRSRLRCVDGRGSATTRRAIALSSMFSGCGDGGGGFGEVGGRARGPTSASSLRRRTGGARRGRLRPRLLRSRGVEGPGARGGRRPRLSGRGYDGGRAAGTGRAWHGGSGGPSSAFSLRRRTGVVVFPPLVVIRDLAKAPRRSSATDSSSSGSCIFSSEISIVAERGITSRALTRGTYRLPFWPPHPLIDASRGAGEWRGRARVPALRMPCSLELDTPVGRSDAPRSQIKVDTSYGGVFYVLAPPLCAITTLRPSPRGSFVPGAALMHRWQSTREWEGNYAPIVQSLPAPCTTVMGNLCDLRRAFENHQGSSIHTYLHNDEPPSKYPHKQARRLPYMPRTLSYQPGIELQRIKCCTLDLRRDAPICAELLRREQGSR